MENKIEHPVNSPIIAYYELLYSKPTVSNVIYYPVSMSYQKSSVIKGNSCFGKKKEYKIVPHYYYPYQYYYYYYCYPNTHAKFLLTDELKDTWVCKNKQVLKEDDNVDTSEVPKESVEEQKKSEPTVEHKVVNYRVPLVCPYYYINTDYIGF
ncbi:hypothetical protein HEP_00051200 [Hepatocystis sp. ex Piliocolobus tephrosceles]|nr:hypothetical protein HEP_00051200 [Hepatocystis sp. ex Piliocolobus tephrosceles]